MPSPVTKPAEVGFAEFTGQLISETFQAVVQSLAQQEREIRELERLVSMELPDFARATIAEDVLRAEIIRLFPSKEGKEAESSIDPGSLYTPRDEKQAEDPAIFIQTGYLVTEEDIERDAQTRRFKITSKGYGHIKERARLSLAAAYKESLLALFQKGMPRVLVDHGRINTKLSFYLTQKTEETKPKVSSSFIYRASLPRLTVKPVSNRTPEFLTLKVDVIGEVEITFKTISI
ncbi:MAG: hypothetical protein AB1487_04730 [Thermodesulfobacteriota bacterium]